MSAIFRLLFRFVAITLGYALACLALSGFAHLLVLGGIVTATAEQNDVLVITSVVTVPVLAALAGYHLFLPAAVLIALAEIRGTRDWLAHSLGGAVATIAAAWFAANRPAESFSDTGLMAVVIASGLVGGWIYWLVAGRRSGAWRAPLSVPTSSGS